MYHSSFADASSLYPYSHKLRVAVVGRNRAITNYTTILGHMGVSASAVLDADSLSAYDALVLPGGGDITPAFFGQHNRGSKNIDTELDIIQLQALDQFVQRKRPVLGICKGMQLINVFFGGTIIQDIKESARHAWNQTDQIHPTTALANSYLAHIYGEHFWVNSAHHQAIGTPGHSLHIIQTAMDHIPEGIAHDFLPILGVQWHPERIPADLLDGRLLFSYFLSLCLPL